MQSPYRKSIQWQWYRYYVNGRVATRAMAYDALKSSGRVEVFAREAKALELTSAQVDYYRARHARQRDRAALRRERRGQ